METELEFEYVRVQAKEGRTKRRYALGPNDIMKMKGERNEDNWEEKENSAPCLRNKTKTRLQRLGVLYGDGEISSPIHKSEDTWDVEDEEGSNQPITSDKYCEERSKRFRALASTINSWEDDIRHISPKKEEPERYDRFGNKIGSKAVKHEPVQAAPSKQPIGPHSPKSKEKFVWDKKIINSLENQGFKRCDSEEHLIYDYVSPDSKKCTSPRKTPGRKFAPPAVPPSMRVSPLKDGPTHSKKSTERFAPAQNTVKDVQRAFLGSPSAPRKVLEEIPLKKVVTNNFKVISPERKVSQQALTPRTPDRKSPQKSAVLEIAAQFEGPPTSLKPLVPNKDPALLSVAEKRAVFEKNNWFIPIPLAPLTQAAVINSHNQLPREKSPIRRPYQDLPSKCDTDSPVRHNVNQAVIERFREIEALRHRWDRNKALSSVTEEPKKENILTTPSEPKRKSGSPRSIPVPPPMPHSILSPQTPLSNTSTPNYPPKPAFTPSPPPKSPQGNRIRMGTKSPVREERTNDSPPRRQLPRVLSIKEKSPKRDYPYPCVKRIKVSPPKPGHIYPSVSDIETESEVPESDLEPIEEEGSELEEDGRRADSISFSSELDSSVGSLGQQIVRQASKTNLKRSSLQFRSPDIVSTSSSYSDTESQVLREMDELLDEAMSAMPSPPKRTRESFESVEAANSETCSTASFEYTSSENDQKAKPNEQCHTPLMHSISLYRKQQTLSTTPTVRREVRTGEEFTCTKTPEPIPGDPPNQEELVVNRIKELQTEVQKQLETISQASKALNLCHSTPGFSGSAAEVEAQKLLLIANARWSMLNQEIERLKIERKLKPGLPGRMDRGDIVLSKLSLPLKSFQQSSDAPSSAVVLVKSGPTVLHTEVLTVDKKSIRDGRLSFQKVLTLKGLYSDFTASIEVYGYTPKKGDLSCPDLKHRTPSRKEKRSTTPKKNKDKAFLPVESPAGPNVVRTSSFQLWGFAVFSLREVNRSCFTLNKVPYTCPLEGSLEISLSSSMQSQVEHAGFLTKFEDVSGFGAWKRRWAVLRGSSIAFWAYPDQCNEGKVPMDTIDLSQVSSEEAGLAPNERCARPHTILFESKVPDTTVPESLVARRVGSHTIITHLLSADTKDERLLWCEQINKVLHLLRAWKVSKSM